jgi:hypothetical protein
MLIITIPAAELWDEAKSEFVYSKPQELRLEHSLVSLSKWESKWCKPFLGKEDKTAEETIDYLRCMTLTQNVNPAIYNRINNKIVEEINEYIKAPMTATTFNNTKKTINRDVITSEIIYYWMIALNIPFECQKWHLNRLLTLINVCNIKNQPKKKMSKKEIANRNRSLNAARRQSLNTRG